MFVSAIKFKRKCMPLTFNVIHDYKHDTIEFNTSKI